jgi:phosphoribosyl-ATP pyrophosphohydrolase/phosphoribosyl-AMP cyclohydrolase
MDLIPAVVQHYASGQVLMVAYMNSEAVRLTKQTGFVHFWSRSRSRLWRKGETSGHALRLIELRLDCDNDCLLVRAQPSGPVCHTGRATCFFCDTDEGAPPTALEALERLIGERRRGGSAESSYTRQLVDAGVAKIIGKITEECGELCAELADGPPERVISECADLLYHVMVGLGVREVPLGDVLAELARRLGTSGIVEKERRRTAPPREHPRTPRSPARPLPASAAPRKKKPPPATRRK